MILKKLFFRDKDTTSVDTWEVRWESRYGAWYRNVSPEVRVFVSREDAEEFAKALKDAFRLIRHTSGTLVVVAKHNVGGE